MRALLVDDEKTLLDAVARGLCAEGFVVETAGNGVDGIWMARENDFDVIILDVMLPDMSGVEICRSLRADGTDTPILMLTAVDDELDEARALDLGADDYLAKPFSFVVLLARLRALLRRAPAGRAPMLESGQVRLDPATRRCWREGHDVHLTPREFALAEFLLRRKGRVVSRTSIAEHVWDAELDIDSNVVEVYISYLRGKLSRADIETVRGAGYRFIDRPPAELE